MDTNHDLKTTILGMITGLFTILAACGVHIPGILQSQMVEGIIAGVAAGALGYYTNKTKTQNGEPISGRVNPGGTSLADAGKAMGEAK